MRIAVTYDNGEIFQHFGRTEQFKFYDVQNGAVKAAQVVSAEGFSHEGLAVFLPSHLIVFIDKADGQGHCIRDQT